MRFQKAPKLLIYLSTCPVTQLKARPPKTNESTKGLRSTARLRPGRHQVSSNITLQQNCKVGVGLPWPCFHLKKCSSTRFYATDYHKLKSWAWHLRSPAAPPTHLHKFLQHAAYKLSRSRSKGLRLGQCHETSTQRSTFSSRAKPPACTGLHLVISENDIFCLNF